jgi:hypothetical protein
MSADILSEKKIKAIHDINDIPLIVFLDNLPKEDRNLIYKSIRVKEEFEPTFEKFQEPWINDYKEYWGLNNEKNPDEFTAEFSKDYLASGEYERCRICFAVKRFDCIEIPHVNEKTLDFLLEAHKLIK